MIEPEDAKQVLSKVAWKVLFGEDYEDIPDPNKPENSAYINAKRKENIEKFKRFVEGPGSVIFEKWQSRVRVGIFNIMTRDHSGCTCGLTYEVDRLQFLFKLLAEAQAITEKQ